MISIGADSQSIRCGDQNYQYSREGIELWLKHIVGPALEYPSE